MVTRVEDEQGRLIATIEGPTLDGRAGDPDDPPHVVWLLLEELDGAVSWWLSAEQAEQSARAQWDNPRGYL